MAKSLAAAMGAHLVLFRVDLPLRASVFMAPVMGMQPGEESARSGAADEHMNDVAIGLREDGLLADVEVVRLEEANEVVTEARARIADWIGGVVSARSDQDDIDLVVMASHGSTASQSVRWGSVCQATMVKTKKPLVLVPVSQAKQDSGSSSAEPHP